MFFIFTRSLGEWSNLTDIFEMGWNHHWVLVERLNAHSQYLSNTFVPSITIDRLKYPKQSWLIDIKGKWITKC